MTIPNSSRNRITVDLPGYYDELLRHLCRGGNGLFPVGERGAAGAVIRTALDALAREVIPPAVLMELINKWSRFDPRG